MFHSHCIEVAEKGLLCKHPLSNKFWSAVTEMSNSWFFCLWVVRESLLVLLKHISPIKPGIFKQERETALVLRFRNRRVLELLMLEQGYYTIKNNSLKWVFLSVFLDSLTLLSRRNLTYKTCQN